MRRPIFAILVPCAETLLMDIFGFLPETILWTVFLTGWLAAAYFMQADVLSPIRSLKASDKAVFYASMHVFLVVSMSLVALGIFDPIRMQMYKTGRYPEPDFNRFIEITRIDDVVLFECGVRAAPLDEFRCFVWISNYDEADVSLRGLSQTPWLSTPGSKWVRDSPWRGDPRNILQKSGQQLTMYTSNMKLDFTQSAYMAWRVERGDPEFTFCFLGEEGVVDHLWQMGCCVRDSVESQCVSIQ